MFGGFQTNQVDRDAPSKNYYFLKVQSTSFLSVYLYVCLLTDEPHSYC